MSVIECQGVGVVVVVAIIVVWVASSYRPKSALATTETGVVRICGVAIVVVIIMGTADVRSVECAVVTTAVEAHSASFAVWHVSFDTR